jgi:hypothetical protein
MIGFATSSFIFHLSYLPICAPGWTRTSDPQLRRLLLYPPELRAHKPEPGLRGFEQITRIDFEDSKDYFNPENPSNLHNIGSGLTRREAR